MRQPWRAFCDTVHLVALGLWLGALVMTGAAAAVIFPTMKNLDPRLPGYAAYTGEHWMIAAGRTAQQLFLINDLIQFPCALAAAATFICLIVFFRLPRPRASTYIRALALGVAIAAVAGQLIILGPSMNAAAAAFWAAAQAGDMAAAERHRAAFTEFHPIATTVMTIDAIAVLVALIAGAWATSPGGRAADGSLPPTGPRSALQEPALLRMPR